MVIQQRTYLNASIQSVNMNMGWNSSPSTCSVELVEDDKNGDNFIQPSIGGPTFFEYYGLNLGGIITSSRRNSNTGGDPTYSVTLEDPRSILEGVQLIIDGYNGGVFNTPNLYNVFGYWESSSFGNSQVNNTGMPWKKIRDGIIALVNQYPIVFGETRYYLNLSALPNLPDYFRIAGPNLSVMDFITQVCEAASHEFFFNLEQVGNNYYIKLYTVNRSHQPELNRISTFINSQEEVVSTSTGFQLRNETSSRFLVGGNVHAMYFQYPSGKLETTRNDDVIWPFWGVDEDNNVIIGGNNPDRSGVAPVSGSIVDYIGNLHAFTIPSRNVNVVGVPDKYTTDVAELRAALGGIDTWKAFLRTYVNDKLSPHYLKASRTAISPDIRFDILDDSSTPSGVASLTPMEYAYLTGGSITKSSDSLLEIHEENISRLFEYVKGFASEYYGRKFMVRLPNIKTKINQDTNQLEHNLEPADGGFLEDTLWSGAIANNYLPANINTLLLTDNRIAPYVRFNDFTQYDLSELGPEDFTINRNNNSLFVKCELDEDIYFLNYSKLYSPRIVITLPGPIYKKEKDTGKSSSGATAELKAAELADAAMTAAEKAAAVISEKSRLGSDLISFPWGGEAVMPNMAACPMKSNVDFYGPWYAIGANGKTDFQKDESLVPWNYGGFAAMNLAANAQISSALSNLQIGEEGTLEVEGVPSFSIGDQLISGGPYITDINVSVSKGGIITTYTMNTWGVRNTGVQKQLVEQVKAAKINQQKIRRENRELNSQISANSAKKRGSSVPLKERGKLTIPRARSSKSTHPVIASEMIQNEDNTYKANTVTLPGYQIGVQLGREYEKKAVNTLDTLFRPFSTDPEYSGLPHFEAYSGSDPVNVNTLNPFPDSDFVLTNKDFPEDDQDLNDADGYERGIGFRMPMIGTGWGYDTNGNPVPNSGDAEEDGDTSVFVENYKKRMDLWKTGPIELPWDEERKVWVGGGSSLVIGVLNENLLYRSSGIMTFWNYNNASGIEIPSDNETYVHDWFLPSGGLIWSGRHVAATKISGRYYIISTEPNC